MSSPDNPTSGDDASREPTAEELTDAPGAQAEVERTVADDHVEDAASTGPGSEPTAAEQGPIPAPGAPGEPSSDADRSADVAPASPQGAGDEGAPESAPADAGSDEVPPAVAEPPSGATADPIVADQPPPTPSAAVAASVGKQAEAAAADKEAQARAVADATAAAAPEPERQPDAEVTPATADGEAAQAAAAEPEPEPVEIDPVRQPLLDTLRQHLGEDVVATHVVPGLDAWARVRPGAWRRAAEVCRDELGLTYFGYVSAIDWMPSPFGKSEDGGLGRPATETADAPAAPAIESGVAGGDTRFQLIARLHSPTTGIGIHLKADVPEESMQVESWTGVFAGADWHERETAEMFGIGFAGHPNLVKIYLPGEFEGYPLRKDFPLLAREVKPWPGLVDVEPMPGEDEPETTEAGAEA